MALLVNHTEHSEEDTDRFATNTYKIEEEGPARPDAQIPKDIRKELYRPICFLNTSSLENLNTIVL